MGYLAQRDVPGATPMSDNFLQRFAIAPKATGYFAAVLLTARNATA